MGSAASSIRIHDGRIWGSHHVRSDQKGHSYDDGVGLDNIVNNATETWSDVVCWTPDACTRGLR